MYKLKPLLADTWKHWKEISFVYAIQLLLGLIATVTLYAEMLNYFDESMILDHLAKGFDRSVFMDLVHSNDGILTSTKPVAFTVLVIYLLLGVFLQGGWLANIRNNQYDISSLLSNGLKYIIPFLGLGVISVLLVGIVGVGGGMIFMKVVGDPLVTFSSEKPYVLWIVCLAILLVFWSITVWAWSVASRCHFISGSSFLAALKKGLKSLLSDWFKFQAIGFLILGIHVFFMFSYYWIMGDRGAPSWCFVILGIIIQQVYHYLRVILRGFGFALVDDLV